MRRDLFAVSITDEVTVQTIGSIYQEHGLMLEPHGAVGWAGLLRYLDQHSEAEGLAMVSLETAHPAKFPGELRRVTGSEPPLPPSLQGIEEKPEHFGEMEVDYEAFKQYLLEEYAS
jgi:threonine synthase